MVTQNKLLSYLFRVSLLLAVTINLPVSATSAEARLKTSQFRQVEQPFELKLGVTLGGLTLIGLELWWFVFSKPQAKQAQNQSENPELRKK